MENYDGLKEQLAIHLKGGEAYMPLEEILKKIAFTDIGKRPAGLPYSFYEIFCHIRNTQKDILDYCTQRAYTAPDWPDGYWPNQKAPDSEAKWEEVQRAYFAERDDLERFLLTSGSKLSDPVPSSPKHSYFREFLLVIEHTSYHSGQLLILLRHLGLHTS